MRQPIALIFALFLSATPAWAQVTTSDPADVLKGTPLESFRCVFEYMHPTNPGANQNAAIDKWSMNPMVGGAMAAQEIGNFRVIITMLLGVGDPSSIKSVKDLEGNPPLLLVHVSDLESGLETEGTYGFYKDLDAKPPRYTSLLSISRPVATHANAILRMSCSMQPQ